MKTIQAAKQKQSEMQNRLNSLGNVNMKALEIYDEVRKEWEKLNWRVTKLDTERQSIADVINAIENKKTNVFMETFNKISTNFSRIYSNINNNMITGNIILENEDNPFDGGVIIKIIKPGTNSLTALSGGEKAMVALSFLFAIAEFNPSPFYLLDEIDAPLDGVNVTKMAELLNEYAKTSQIIIISHKDSVMSSAELLHGVWMNKKHGESHISSMKVK
jgi:chromosome segregation protein